MTAKDGLIALRHALATRYTVERALARGGMATVYLARDLKHHRRVAVKVMRWELASASAAKRFVREIKICAKLQHPHILPLFDSGEVDGLPYYVMPYVEGESLRSRIKREGRLGVEDAVAITCDVASALDYAHRQGVVHRDIKPENILLSGGHAIVADFGVARALGHAGTDHPGEKLTATGFAIGTRAYMSPEQLVGERGVDARSDIYSLGCVVHEMLTGTAPFERQESLALRLSGVRPRTAHLRPDVPPRIDEAVHKALASELEERWQSVSDFADAVAGRGTPRAAEPSAADAGGPAAVDAMTSAMAGASSERPTRKRPGPRQPRPPSDRVTVGREQERAELRVSFASALSERGLLVCVAGEPGIGKTTLVEDFLGELAACDPPHSVARGRCSERLAGAEAYLPILEALDSLLRSDSDVSLGGLMRTLAPSWYAQLAPAPTGAPAGTRATTQSQPPSQERMKRELSQFLQEASKVGPLIVFLEDVHWADVSTVDILSYLAGKFEAMRLLVVTTYRPSELLLGKHPFATTKLELQARGLCREITLPFLTREDIERYLTLRFPGHGFPAEFPALIHARTEGNPLFIVDLIRYLLDRGLIMGEYGREALTRPVIDIGRDLPETMRSMVQRKIEQLSDPDRRLLAVASVQGNAFDAAVVARVLKLDAADVEEQLDVLERVHAFVRCVDEREYPDHTLTARYMFVHVLYQNALHAALAPTRRASLSGSVAQALLGFYGERSSAIAAELAILFETARDAAQAAQFFLQAARNAVQVFANEEAIALARRGLAQLPLLPESPQSKQLELTLNLTLGYPLTAVEGYAAPDVEQAFNRVLELCQELGEQSSLFPAVWGLWGFYFIRGDLAKALPLAEQLLRPAQDTGDPALLVPAHLAMGMTLGVLGQPATSLDHLNRGVQHYDPQHHRSPKIRYGDDPGVVCLSWSLPMLWLLGHADQALERGRRALALAEELKHPQGIAFARHVRAFLRQLRREPKAAQAEAEVALGVAREHNLANWKAWSGALHGWAIAAQGRVDEGVAEIREGLAANESIGAGLSYAHFLLLLAEVLGAADRSDEALETIATGFAAVERTQERYLAADLHRLHGELIARAAGARRGARVSQAHAAEGEPSVFAKAATSIERAIAMARQQGAKSLELRATTSLCRLYPAGEKRRHALDRLAGIYGQFTEGFDTPDLRAAGRLLAAPRARGTRTGRRADARRSPGS
jgi:predicted ATPase/tRNA A-37 threonylcarbamoyl transferase component Bud32